MTNSKKERPVKRLLTNEIKVEDFSKSELKLLNLIAEIIIEIILDEEEKEHTV